MSEKITLIKHPVEWVKFLIAMKRLSLDICGKWFGIVFLPTGRVIFNDDKVVEYMHEHMQRNSRTAAEFERSEE